jgi:8-oxo-dGTP pyrophosphatase MutT (NUDIX family)
MTEPQPDLQQPVRDAASLILVRRDGLLPRVLMGQRGAGAAFMPQKYVFPGGRVDDADHALRPLPDLAPGCAARLDRMATPGIGAVLAAAALRETFEETGLILGRPGQTDNVPEAWRGFAATGHVPDGSALRFVFRAVTPPGRTRRFDARFFLADAAALAGDPDDLSRAGGELAHLAWLTLDEARRLDLPFITQVVLGEVESILGAPGAARHVPFFHHAGGRSFVSQL